MICCCLNSGWFVCFIRLLPQLWKVVGGYLGIHVWMDDSNVVGVADSLPLLVEPARICKLLQALRKAASVFRRDTVGSSSSSGVAVSFALKTQDLMLQPRLTPDLSRRCSGSNPSMQAADSPTYLRRLHATSSPDYSPPPCHPIHPARNIIISFSRHRGPPPHPQHYIILRLLSCLDRWRAIGPRTGEYSLAALFRRHRIRPSMTNDSAHKDSAKRLPI